MKRKCHCRFLQITLPEKGKKFSLKSLKDANIIPLLDYTLVLLSERLDFDKIQFKIHEMILFP